ncbi:MAG: hypothetical protein LBS31_03610 [Candidatus Adiutrix sp.]|jgi:hypothetical protein|nr:hypothetical protein [Candidatus Adiutrix sp.]
MSRKKKLTTLAVILALIFGAVLFFTESSLKDYEDRARTEEAQPGQTAVDQMEIVFSSDGVMRHNSPEHGPLVLPGWLAFHALYMLNKGRMSAEEEKQYYGCLNWLKDNLREKKPGLWVWDYPLDNTYNDITIKAPWDSAFAQGVGVSLFLKAWEKEQDDIYLEAAEKAASGLFIDLKEGGLADIKGDEVWFEEVPWPLDNPTHILNAHMSSLIALKDLHEATGKQPYGDLFDRGLATLKKRLPLFDAGYALRYDLNPQKKEILFKIANPYNFATFPLAMEKISIKDPLSGRQLTIEAGSDQAFEGDMRLSGLHWSQPEEVAGRTARRLVSVEAGETSHSYFVLKLPSEWTDNLRREEFEIYVTYYDEAPANLNVQKRAMAPGPEYRDLKSGNLLLTGSGQWREWLIPLAPSDLGWWVGESYNAFNGYWLRRLGQYDPDLLEWALIADGYHRAGVETADPEVVEAKIDPAKATEGASYGLETVEPLRLAADFIEIETNNYYDMLSSLTALGNNQYLYCDYINIYFLSLGSGSNYTITQVEPLGLNSDFVPTGLYYHQGTLYIANYTGNNILAGQLSADNSRLEITRSITHPALISPENIFVDDEIIVTANYDGNNVTCFDHEGRLLWEVKVPNAHGIDGNKDFLTVTGLGERKIYKLSRSGEVLRTTGQLGWELNEYAWPTDIDILPANEILVTDAHTGRITKLDYDLKPIKAWGINGSARADFNFPYALYPREQGLIICDTFKGRFLFLNQDFQIEKIIYLNGRNPEAGDKKLWGMKTDAYAYPSLDEEPLNILLQDFFPPNDSLSYMSSYNGFRMLIGEEIKKYIIMNSNNLTKPDFYGFFWYVTMAEKLPHDSGRYYVIFSPQNYHPLFFDSETKAFFLTKLDAIPYSTWSAAESEYIDEMFQKIKPHFMTLEKAMKSDDDLLKLWDQYLGKDSNNLVPGLKELLNYSEAGKKISEKIQNGRLTSADLAEFKQAISEDLTINLLECLAVSYLAQNSAQDKTEDVEDIALSAAVAASSPVYPDFPVENALDGDPNDDYAAMLEGETPQGFILELGRRALIHEISLVFENEVNFPFNFTVDSVAYSKDVASAPKISLIAEVKNHQGKIWRQKFDPPVSAAFVRFMAGAFSGQPRLLLRQVEIMAEPPSPLQSLLLAPGAQEVAAAHDDPANPLRIFSFYPITKGMNDVARLIIGDENLSPHQKIVKFMHEFDDHEYYAMTKTATGVETMLTGIGGCGTWTNALMEFAWTQGWEGRIVYLHNFPVNAGHTLAEIKINGQWRLYDPTYGLYYTTEPENSLDPQVLGYEELRRGGALAPGVARVAGNEKRLAAGGAFADPLIFTQAQPAGPIGQDKPMVFPLTLALNSVLESEKFDTSTQGAPYIGAAYVNNHQKWTLTGLRPGQNYAFIITPAYIDDQEKSAGAKGSFILQARFENAESSETLERTFQADDLGPWRLEFTAAGDEAALYFSHPYLGPKSRYLGVKSYELKESASSGDRDAGESRAPAPEAPEAERKPPKADALEDLALSAAVAASSPVYPDFPVENALDGDPNDDYAAMLEGEAPQGFILELGRRALIHEISLVFENEVNYPSDFTLDSVGYSQDIAKAVRLSLLADVKSHAGKIWRQKFDPPVSAAFVRFMAGAFSGQPRLLLRQVEIMAGPPSPLQSLLLAPGAQEVAAAPDDPANPLKIFSFYPITKGMNDVARLIIGDENLSPHQKIVKFMHEFDDHEYYALTKTVTGAETMLTGIGGCGSWTAALMEFAWTQGLEGRIVNLHNFPVNAGHTLAEIKVNGRWQLYDPTYGLYYTAEPENSLDPQVLGYEELRRGGALAPGVARVAGNEKRLAAGGAFADPLIFTQAQPAGPIGQDKPMVFPLTLALNSVLESEKFDTSTQGAPYIGAAYVNNHQKWTLTGLRPGQNYAFTITPAHIVDQEKSAGEKGSFILQARFENAESSETLERAFQADDLGPWRLEFTAAGDEAALYFSHPYLGPKNRYLSVKSYELKESASGGDPATDGKS